MHCPPKKLVDYPSNQHSKSHHRVDFASCEQTPVGHGEVVGISSVFAKQTVVASPVVHENISEGFYCSGNARGSDSKIISTPEILRKHEWRLAFLHV